MDGGRVLYLLPGEVPWLFQKQLERISGLLSGVRSSCDMLARNSFLYLDVSASARLLLQLLTRELDLAVLALHLPVLLRKKLRLLLQLFVGLLELSCCCLSSSSEACRN